MQGASVVVYMGHGSGFPNPYVSAPNPYNQNGMGLNLTAGDGDYNNKYYGEAYIANEVDLAPNAVVILSHLCYSAGNSEPGKTDPTLAVAKARMDNYAAGFLRAGAQAVIAEAHNAPSYTPALHTHRTIEQIWQRPPYHGHVFVSASADSTCLVRPDSLSGSTYSGFFRCSLRADAHHRHGQGPATSTDTNPATLVVPGAPRSWRLMAPALP
jgi:hypothetical protein